MDVRTSHSFDEQTCSAWVENPCHGDASRFAPARRLIGPRVEPVADDLPRPLWSVMIPAYNCAEYLRHTLHGVLEQDPGAERMQIEVVDDVSTRDDPEAIVREMGWGRVGFFRQPENVGAIENFNTCVRRSRGELIHVLHGDDMVERGFYSTLEGLASRHPDANLLATRAWTIDERGTRVRHSPFVPAWERTSTDSTPLWYSNPLRTPSTVIRRSFYETFGGFLSHLVHTADREMWERGVGLGGGVLADRLLASYRVFDGNHTSRLLRSGDNLRDWLRLADVFAARNPAFSRPRFCWAARVTAVQQMTYFRQHRDPEAVEANRQILRSLDDSAPPSLWRLKELLWSVPYAHRFALLVLKQLTRAGLR